MIRVCDLHGTKTSFRTRGLAESTIATIRRFGDRQPSGKKPIRAYVCSGCGRWFITSEPK